jgi:NAD(P)-dependent dehydrogenase (short-subunit alcohol dehydrogenase family)
MPDKPVLDVQIAAAAHKPLALLSPLDKNETPRRRGGGGERFESEIVPLCRNIRTDHEKIWPLSTKKRRGAFLRSGKILPRSKTVVGSFPNNDYARCGRRHHCANAIGRRLARRNHKRRLTQRAPDRTRVVRPSLHTMKVKIGTFQRHQIVDGHNAGAFYVSRQQVVRAVKNIDPGQGGKVFRPPCGQGRIRARPDSYLARVHSWRERTRGQSMPPEKKMIVRSQIGEMIYQRLNVGADAARFLTNISGVDRHAHRLWALRYLVFSQSSQHGEFVGFCRKYNELVRAVAGFPVQGNREPLVQRRGLALAGADDAGMKRIFITGASAGIGLATAKLLAERGDEVWGTARDVGRVPELPRLHAVRLDLSDNVSLGESFRMALREAGQFDVVINNAGSGHFGPGEHLSAEAVHAQFQTVVFAHIELCRLALASMLNHGSGRIINVTSLASRLPVPFMAAYNAAKAAMASFVMSLQLELGGSDIRVIDLQPADIRTSFNDAVARTDGGDPHYTALVEHAWRVVDRNMQEAPKPELVARRIAKLIDEKNPPPRVTVGGTFQASIAPFVLRFLPQRVLIWGLKNYYRLPN